MNYLFNDRNLIRGAVLSALNLVPSAAIFRTDNDPKIGSGVVSLSGPYTGEHDTLIELEILDGDGDSSQVSTPTFNGVGNGTMTGVSVTGLGAQTFNVSLTDLGTVTAKATAPFQGATLQAIAESTAGNSIEINVDGSGIIRSASDKSLLEQLSAGTNEYTGNNWDFGGPALDGSGNIPADAPRVSFGDDPQVYRQFKVYDFDAQQWVYSFSPPPVRDVAVGEVMKNVTGNWVVTISDGVTDEDYPGVTLYDILSGIQSGPSALVTVTTTVTQNFSPNGQASTDVSVLTQPMVLSITEDGSTFVRNVDLGFTITGGSPTEQVFITCIDDSIVGREIWTVRGDISGDLGNATTGAAYSSGPYSFLIPVQEPTQPGTDGNINVTLQLIERDAAETRLPNVCVDFAQLGINATSKTFTFVYRRVPPPGCDCTTGTLVGGPSADCLGLEVTGGGAVSDAGLVLLRQQKLITALRGFIEGNTTPPDEADSADIRLAKKGAQIFADALTKLSAPGAKITYLAWQPSHAYVVGDIIQNTTFRYIAVQPGTSGGSAPAFPTTAFDAVTDNTVQWVTLGLTALDAFDAFLTDWKTDVATVSGVEHIQSFPKWTPGMQVVVHLTGGGDTVTTVVPTVATGFHYTASGSASGTFATGQTEPVWPLTAGQTVNDGPNVDGQGLIWTAVANSPASTDDNVPDELFDRYRSQMNEVLFAAEVEANFNQASTDGDGCWQDHPEASFAFFSQDGLMPLFVGFGYHSSKPTLDQETGKLVPRTTGEFYIGLKWGCPELLKEGDSFTVVTDGNAGGGAYQESDTFTVVVADQGPVHFGGGQTGNNMITFSVFGSSDGPFPPYYLPLTAPAPRVNSHLYAVGDRYVPAVANGRFYQVTVGGTSASSPPTFATDRSTFTDGTATVQDMGRLFDYSEGGLAFTITRGGIPFVLADTFTFNAIGGHYRWRQDGGTWNGPTVIGDGALVDGLVVTFTGGATDPSWSPPDAYAFRAIATNGPDQAKTPADGRLVWTGSTTITITPSSVEPASRFAVYDHHIPSDAVITLQGSNSATFATTPLNIVIPWAARNLLVVFPEVTYTYWRLIVDKGGDLFWYFLGEEMQPTTPNARRDAGLFKKRRRTPGIGIRSGISGDIQHEWTSQESYEDFMDGIDHACANDDGAFGLVINESLGEMSLVRFPPGAEVNTTELRNYQTRNPDGVIAPARRQAFSLAVNALP